MKELRGVYVTGEHVTSALTLARVDQDSFRREELEWMENHNLPLRTLILRMFEARVNVNGIVTAEASLAGAMLGHRSVRLCSTAPSEIYEVGRRNFEANVSSPLNKGAQPLDNRERLGQVFEDTDLVDALLEVSHPGAMDSAATIIGYFLSPEFAAHRTKVTKQSRGPNIV